MIGPISIRSRIKQNEGASQYEDVIDEVLKGHADRDAFVTPCRWEDASIVSWETMTILRDRYTRAGWEVELVEIEGRHLRGESDKWILKFSLPKDLK